MRPENECTLGSAPVYVRLNRGSARVNGARSKRYSVVRLGFGGGSSLGLRLLTMVETARN
jgi:hypothetical protein